MVDGDPGGAAHKMVADSQGKVRGQGAVVQGVVEPRNGYLCGCPQAEGGENARGFFGKFDGSPGEDRGDVVPADEPAPGTVAGKIPQGLEIGDGVVKPWAVHGPVE